MRSSAAALLAALALAASASGSPSSSAIGSTASSTVVITGHGFGHGVGMGQWGAYGYALHGWSYQRILEHYYSGTTVGAAPTQIVRVLLEEANGSVSLGSAAPWSLVDGVGQELNLPAGRARSPGFAPGEGTDAGLAGHVLAGHLARRGGEERRITGACSSSRTGRGSRW